MNTTDIRSWHLAGKEVFVRIDGNVPIERGIIQNDFRLKAVLPTLDILKEKGAHITIATHLGRPDGKDPAFSTKPLKQWFAQQGHAAATVLENLRFHPGEKNNDPLFAKELARGMDFYVNDAWGVLHRHDASVTQMPLLFHPERRAFGCTVERELAALNHLREQPEQPYVVILGGGKPETKLPVLERLLERNMVATILLLPALTFTLLKALGRPVGASLVAKELLASAHALVTLAETHAINLVLPIDYTVLRTNWQGPLELCDADHFPADGIGIGVGPRSLELFEPYLRTARTIFFNGAMGIPDRPDTMAPLHALLRMIAASPSYSVIGGGNSITEIEHLGLMQSIDYCSTGGGATLTYISDGPMPGLAAMQSPAQR